MKKLQHGFTLIELMIVVAIIGILAAIAVPSYSNYITESRRSDGMGALVALSQAMERYYTENSNYTDATIGSGGIFPNEAPLDSGKKYYDLQIVTQDATSYSLRAVPKNEQAGDGNLTLDSTGARTWNGQNGWDHDS